MSESAAFFELNTGVSVAIVGFSATIEVIKATSKNPFDLEVLKSIFFIAALSISTNLVFLLLGNFPDATRITSGFLASGATILMFAILFSVLLHKSDVIYPVLFWSFFVASLSIIGLCWYNFFDLNSNVILRLSVAFLTLVLIVRFMAFSFSLSTRDHLN